MRRRAFTLVELLVVISIMALLTALSFPVLTGSRAQARTVACRANIRHMVLSLCQYDSEHDSLPYGNDFARKDRPPGGCVGNARYDFPGWWWFHYTGLVQNRSRQGLKLLQCPSKRLEDPVFQKDLLCGNYGINRSLCRSAWWLKPYDPSFVGAPLSVRSLPRPGSTLLVVDSGYGVTCWWHATAEPPSPLGGVFVDDVAYIPGLEINKIKILWPGQSYDAIGGRHPNRAVNIGFADGHAETRCASELLVTRTAGGGYTNTLLWQGQ